MFIMMKDLFRAKIKAAGIHLSISVLIFFGVLYFILFEWYPGVLFEAEGAFSGVKLMAAIDLILGPLLTLIIYNHTKGKKEIVFDLSLIATIQVSALIWGGLQVYAERPVAMVMWEGTFYTVTEDYYNKQNISLKTLAKYSDEKPLLIFAETDHSVKQLKEIMRLNEQQVPPYAQVHLYQSVKENVDKVLSNQLLDDSMLNHYKQEKTNTRQSVFLVKAKFTNLLVYLDSTANLLKVTMRPDL